MILTYQAHAPAIHCEGCANAIKRSLGKLEGIQSVAVDVDAKTVTAQYDDARLHEPQIRERLEQSGFPPD